MKKETKLYIDPPSGWKYGYPMEITEDQLDNNYPEKDIELALEYSRYWRE